MARYARPETLDEALHILSGGSWRILAGGTDFYPAQGARPIVEDILDINGIASLRGVAETGAHWVIGARTTWSDLVGRGLPPAFDALKAAAREVGAIQIQNMATVAGNLCNASPAADGAPALMVLDAEVELASTRGLRHLPLDGFILGNRRTALLPDEMVTAIRVPRASCGGSSAFSKLGARRYLVISIAMTAVRLAFDTRGRLEEAAVAVGACSAVATRLPELERDLRAAASAADLADVARPEHFARLAPIDDVRASADYRRDAAFEIVRRTIGAAAAAALPAQGRAA